MTPMRERLILALQACAATDDGSRVDAEARFMSILAEMREPDAAMVDAAYEAPKYWMHDVTETKDEWHDEFRQAWRAAIDAILRNA